MPVFRIREAAELLGVSYDTMLRWADSGKIEKTADSAGRLAVDGAALDRFARDRAEAVASAAESAPVAAQSVRNRFTGLITRVVKDTVMAQVEIQAGPHRFVSLLSREAADELGLEPGMLATAAVKATNVAVEIPVSQPRRQAAPLSFRDNLFIFPRQTLAFTAVEMSHGDYLTTGRRSSTAPACGSIWAAATR